MTMQIKAWHRGVLAALGSAFSFGAGTPLSKSLLGTVNRVTLAGLLHLGFGVGLGIYPLWRGAARTRSICITCATMPAWFRGSISHRHRPEASETAVSW